MQDSSNTASTPQSTALFRLYAVGMYLLCLPILAPTVFFRTPSTGLDPSWEIAINLAVRDGLRFGRDFIFTFGPFGAFSTRLPIALTRSQLLAFDLAVFLAMALILLVVVRWMQSYLALFLVVATVWQVSLIEPYTMGLSNLLYVIWLFLALAGLRRRSWPALAMASLLSWFMFYMKVSLGLPVVVCTIVLLSYLLARPRGLSRRLLIGLGTAFLVLGATLAWALNVDLPGYVLGSLHLSAAYNDAMAGPVRLFAMGQEAPWLALTTLGAFALALLVDFRRYLRDTDALVAYLLVAGYLFLIFKHAFVRAQDHVPFFFHTAPAAIGLLAFFTGLQATAFRRQGMDSPAYPIDSVISRRLSKVFLLSLICAIPFSTWQLTLDRFEYTARYFAWDYLGQLTTQRPIALYDRSAERELPASILRMIGSSSVDVLPWEISYAWVNGLSYNPRPVIQSYTAYDDYLDSLNYQKYVSKSAPDFLLFAMGDIDGRHPFFVEPRTRLAILTHYEVADATGDYLVLRHRDQPLGLMETASKTQHARLGEWIDLEDTKALQFLTAGIEYSLSGSLARTLYQPPLLNVTVQYDDGGTQTYLAVKTLINDHVLVDPFLESLDDARTYFESHGMKSRRIERLKFDTIGRWAFQDTFPYTIKQVIVEEPGA